MKNSSYSFSTEIYLAQRLSFNFICDFLDIVYLFIYLF